MIKINIESDDNINLFVDKSLSVYELRKQIIGLSNRNKFLDLIYNNKIINIIESINLSVKDLLNKNLELNFKAVWREFDNKNYLQINNYINFKKIIKKFENWYKLDDRTSFLCHHNLTYGMEIKFININDDKELKDIFKFFNIDRISSVHPINIIKNYSKTFLVSDFDYIVGELITGDIFLINNILENINYKLPPQLSDNINIGDIIKCDNYDNSYNGFVKIVGAFENNFNKFLICWHIETGNEVLLQFN